MRHWANSFSATLADPHDLRLADGAWLHVRIAEVSPAQIRVKKDDRGGIVAPQLYYTMSLPLNEDQPRLLEV